MKNAQHNWSKHIAAIKFQGVTASAYAKQHDLALATLYYWQRKLRSKSTAGTTVEPMTAPPATQQIPWNDRRRSYAQRGAVAHTLHPFAGWRHAL